MAELRSKSFDLFFVLIVPAIALISTCIVVIKPELFGAVLMADLALLGYHHVIATYTRLALSWSSIRENKFFIFILPFIVLSLVVFLASKGGAWIISTVYLHWQWWHYTRQSEGIEKTFRFKTGSAPIFGGQLDRACFYFIPVATFLYMSSTGPLKFLFMPVAVIPVPSQVGKILLFAAVFLFFLWLFVSAKALVDRKITWNYFSYVAGHHVIYFVAYCVVQDLTVGWLAINIWHNLQYIAFVWHFNSKRFSSGYDPSFRLLSWISQPKRLVVYVGFCLILTYLFYGMVDYLIGLVEPYTVLPVVVIAYQTINFHHYVVDSYIWKLRAPSIKKGLGLQV